MGLLDQVIGGVLGQVLGGGGHDPGRGGGSAGGGQGGALGGSLSPIVQALLMLLMQKGAGGLGDILGGGRGQGSPRPHEPEGRDDGDLGGFGQDAGYAREAPSPSREGDFGDLSGMLDGPGGGNAGAGPYAKLDREASGGQSGLDGLIERFHQGGLGDLMESWIGGGQNRPVQPNQLADALGPDTVNQLEQRTGLGRNDLLAQLAQALPQVIDGLTPHGRRPSADDTKGW